MLRLSSASIALGLVLVACGGAEDPAFSSSEDGGASGGASGSVGATGGSGGTGTGGSSGTGTGGSSGTGTGGSGATGGVAGANATGGSGGVSGSATGGSGGLGGAAGTGSGTGGSAAGMGGMAGMGGHAGTPCTTVWCFDDDGDGYGTQSTMQTACASPGAKWVEQGSKARACGDCYDGDKTVYPGATTCLATGYPTSTIPSFDANCDGQEDACAMFDKAAANGCKPVNGGPGSMPTCDGSGYLPTMRTSSSSAVDPYCGSQKYRQCRRMGDACMEEVFDNFNPITCR